MSSFRPLLLAAFIAAPLPVAAAEIQIDVAGPVVELTVNEVVQSAPDTAMIGAGVTTRAPTASEALKQNAEQMDKVIDRLRSLGIPAKDIQTSSFSLNAQYQYSREGEPPRFLGYDASNQVNVTLRDLRRIGATLDALVAVGATNLYGPNFTLEKDQPAKDAARKAAYERARDLAGQYAKMSGFKGVRLLEVSESFTGHGPMPFAGNAINVTAERSDAKAPVEPGRVGTGVALTAKYEMTR